MVILRVPDCLHNKAISQATAGTMSIITQKTTGGGGGVTYVRYFLRSFIKPDIFKAFG